MPRFELSAQYPPAGDQPKAIAQLAQGLTKPGKQTLLGVTGSGKTFTIANVVQKIQKPTLVLAHNKTLAAQLYNEFKGFFPKNAVHYFVSYYDFYQPESYLPGKDVYIEKEADINQRIEQMRLAATSALFSRSDVLIVSSISCIYGLGDPSNYRDLTVVLEKGKGVSRSKLIRDLVNIQFERNDNDLAPGRFRVHGDTIDIWPGYGGNLVRVQLFGDEIVQIRELHPVNAKPLSDFEHFMVFPAKHFVSPEEQTKRAIKSIQKELDDWLPNLDKELYRERLSQRVRYDLEMLEQVGYCNGIENYSRHFDGRKKGEAPHTLLDYFPKDFLFVIDESHVTLPQAHGMYKGDFARKKNLVDYGFRLPCAFDNRPLQFHEFETFLKNVVFTSATPGDYELRESKGVVEQIVRPTGLVDPRIEVRPSANQIEELAHEVKKEAEAGRRVLVTTLTKRFAEDLTEYFSKAGIACRYMHSEIDTLERTKIIRQLRLKKFDCLIGINLLREGLDIPEVALVAILDADQEGFLRNPRSLIQTIGRAARNADGRVILFADRQTDSMKQAIFETERRRKIQIAYNEAHGITPKSIEKAVLAQEITLTDSKIAHSNIPAVLIDLDAQMRAAAESLDFEKAILLRDQIEELKKRVR